MLFERLTNLLIACCIAGIGTLLLSPMYLARRASQGLQALAFFIALPGAALCVIAVGVAWHELTASDAELLADKAPSEGKRQAAAKAERDAQAKFGAGERQRIQDVWSKAVNDLALSYQAIGAIDGLSKKGPREIVVLARSSRDFAKSAQGTIRDARYSPGEGKDLPAGWEPIFDDLETAAHSIATADDEITDSVETGRESKLMDAQEHFATAGKLIRKAIEDGRALYTKMGGSADALQTYGFKP